MKLTKLAILLCVLSTGAWAHGDAAWIQKGKYIVARPGMKNTGGGCCGVTDCRIIPAETVQLIGETYHFRYEGQAATFPAFYTYPSTDEKYWACRRPGEKISCFFRPIDVGL